MILWRNYLTECDRCIIKPELRIEFWFAWLMYAIVDVCRLQFLKAYFWGAWSVQYTFNGIIAIHCNLCAWWCLTKSNFCFVQELDLYEIIMETERRGIAFEELLTIPEQDDWIYSDGKSTTCVAFILAMYKEAGVFSPFSSSIQVTEFTVRLAHLPPSPLILHLAYRSNYWWTKHFLILDSWCVHAEYLREQQNPFAQLVQ